MSMLQIMAIAAAVVGICMSLSGLLLIGFRRGRLRIYNIYIVFSVAAFGFMRFAEYAAGSVNEMVVLMLWINLAAGSLVGLAGMLKIARTDPPVFGKRRTRLSR